jgi:hypothetical protein
MMIELRRQARRAYPGSRALQWRWLKAVRYLSRESKRGWILASDANRWGYRFGGPAQ